MPIGKTHTTSFAHILHIKDGTQDIETIDM
jgi:hypothetical protein